LNKLPRITVIIPLEDWDEQGGCEEIYAEGFLASEGFAVYLDEEHREIVFVGVIESREPNVFICLTPYLPLGKIERWDQREPVVSAMIDQLKQISAYDFLTKVIVGIGAEIDFDELIVPGLLKT
jgi:hypothetical protein